MKTKKIISVFALIVLFVSTTFAFEKSSNALNLGHMDYFSLTEANDSYSAHILQQPPKFGETPEDSIACVRSLSLYTEYYNQRNFNLAYNPWREALELCPQSSQNIFIRGVVLVKMRYNEETDPIKRDAWVDTLMMVHDKRIEFFGREGFVLGRKAVDLYQLRPNNIQEIYNMTTRSIEIEGNSSQADVLLINMQTLVRLADAGLKDVEEVLLTYDRIMDIIDFNLENNPEDRRLFEPAKGQIDNMFEPFATCDNIITLFKPRFEANPEDVELLERITNMLSNSNCTEETLFYNATRNLHRLQPNAESAFLMGRLENNAQRYNEAVEYFEQAERIYDDDNDKFRALMLLADISYRNLRQFSQARSYALRASALDPENGRPYLLIGEMYAASASACGDSDLTKTVAYWAAVDKFIQARNVDQDPAIQERATSLINTYSQYFPDRELLFFHGLDEGTTYRVQCWINETTRVRPRP
jgi:tetratricopeptide (TPR) repeat protein